MTKNTTTKQAQATNAIVPITKASYVRIAEVNGKEIQLVARPIKLEDFQDKCTVYSLPATRGENKGQNEYFVTREDYNKHKPATQRASVTRDAIVKTLMTSMNITEKEALALHAKMQENVKAQKSSK